MLNCRSRFYAVLLLLFLLYPPLFSHGDETFTLAAVQYEIRFKDYTTEEAFWRHIDLVLEEIFSACNPDLIIFPEYTGVFYTLIPYAREVEENGSLETAVGELRRSMPGVSLPEDLFSLGEEMTNRYIRGWSERAERYSVPILVGTIFREREMGKNEKELRNSALVFDESGNLFYTQDKVYLTLFETEICRISPGDQEAADGFILQGRRIYLTICRDTFFQTWEKKFEDPAFLWIDIKANGEKYNREQRRVFSRALPARFSGVCVDYGLTLCLVGKYLDLLWEGESSLLSREGNVTGKTAVSGFWDREEILYFELQ